MPVPLPQIGDIIDLVLKIKSSIDKVIDNDGKLRALADELYDSVQSLLHCTNNYRSLPRNQTNVFLTQFHDALHGLRRDLLQSLEHCESLASTSVTGHFPNIRSRFHTWWNRDQIAGEIQQIQRKVDHHFRRFSVWGLTAATGAVGTLQADVRACHDLLKMINGRLSETIRKASLDPLKAARLISADVMDGAKLRSSLAHTTKDLQHAGSGSSKHEYLQLKARTLQALLTRPALRRLHHPSSSSVILSTDHTPTDTEMEDPVLRCLDSLHALRVNDHGSTYVLEEPFLNRLDYLSTCLCRTDLATEAVKVMEHLVPIYGSLNRTDPQSYLPRLAVHLNNRSVTLLRTMQSSRRALLDITEAVRMYRWLVNRDPRRYQQALATVLNNLAHVLSLQGYHAECLDAMEECICIRRSSALPHRLSDSFSHTLRHAAARLTHLANKDDALAFSTRAVQLARPLAGELFDTFAPALAASLHSRSSALGHLRRYEEGLSAATEVVGLYTRLEERDCGAHRRSLEKAWTSLSHFRQVVTRAPSATVVREGTTRSRSADRRWQCQRQDRATHTYTRHVRHSSEGGIRDARSVSETRCRTEIRREHFVHHTARSEYAV